MHSKGIVRHIPNRQFDRQPDRPMPNSELKLRTASLGQFWKFFLCNNVLITSFVTNLLRALSTSSVMVFTFSTIELGFICHPFIRIFSSWRKTSYYFSNIIQQTYANLISEKHMQPTSKLGATQKTLQVMCNVENLKTLILVQWI